MKIEFIKTFTDPGNCVYQAGSSEDLPNDRAHTLILHGIARPIALKPSVAVETSIKPRKRKEIR